MQYPATLTPYADGTGRYAITFIDLPGCVSIGQSLDDALRMGAEAASIHIAMMLAEGMQVPQPSTVTEAEKRDKAQAGKRNIPVANGTVYRNVQFEPAREKEEANIIRVTISLKPAMLEMIDNAAREMGVTRSSFIGISAREYCKAR